MLLHLHKAVVRTMMVDVVLQEESVACADFMKYVRRSVADEY